MDESPTLHPDLVTIALERVGGEAFELFVQEYYPALAGVSFVPLGGKKDGGADAFAGDSLFKGRVGHFYQASVEVDYEGKIRKTVARLREFGREPLMLTYVTSQHVRHVDRCEEQLSNELDVAIRIRSRAYIVNNINDSARTRAAFEHFLRPATEFLRHIGAAPVIAPSQHVASPAVYVFLRQEVERQDGDSSIVNAVVESLAQWALEGTDPGLGIFMDRDEIAAKIVETVPSAKPYLDDTLDARLESLSSKRSPTGRQIRMHTKEGLYCLPYEARIRIEEDNREDEGLRLAVLQVFSDRIAESGAGALSPREIREAAEFALRAIQITFERAGLEFSYFLTSSEDHDEMRTVSDSIRMAFDEATATARQRDRLGEAIFTTLRLALYYSTEEERLYFGKMARTYALLFTLNCESRLVKYFDEMRGSFYLYVGSDQLVRALSERFLAPEDQMTRNMLRMAADAGATLVLSEPVLDEVVHHLRSTDEEYQAVYAPIEHEMTMEIARSAPKILLRSYFYARLEGRAARPPADWAAYIGNFCN